MKNALCKLKEKVKFSFFSDKKENPVINSVRKPDTFVTLFFSEHLNTFLTISFLTNSSPREYFFDFYENNVEELNKKFFIITLDAADEAEINFAKKIFEQFEKTEEEKFFELYKLS